MIRFAGETRAAPIARPWIFSVCAPVGQVVMDGGSLGHVRDPGAVGIRYINVGHGQIVSAMLESQAATIWRPCRLQVVSATGVEGELLHALAVRLHNPDIGRTSR